jgi:hypothetical protein
VCVCRYCQNGYAHLSAQRTTATVVHTMNEVQSEENEMGQSTYIPGTEVLLSGASSCCKSLNNEISSSIGSRLYCAVNRREQRQRQRKDEYIYYVVVITV